MQLEVDRETLAAAAGWAARALPTRPVLPILAGMLVEARGELRLSGFDQTSSAGATVAADVAEPGRALVSGRLLAELVRSLPPGPVRVALDDGRVRIRGGSASFRLQCLPVADHPGLPAMPPVAGAVDSAGFATAVSAVVVAAGRDDSLPALTGMHLDVDGDVLTLACTDRYRIAVRSLPWQPAAGAPARFSALVPAAAMAQMAKAAATGPAVSVGLGDDGVVGLACGDREMTTRLLSAAFIPYREHLPAGFTSTSEVPRARLAEAVRRVSLVAERSAPVRLTFTAGEVVLEAATGDEAQAAEAMTAAHEGDDLSLAFNPRYLLDGLAALDSETAVLHCRGPLKPVVLTGGAHAEEPAARYVVMPLRATR